MPFQFLCPLGHLLEGDEAHMGLTTRCPHCGMTFVIPTLSRGSEQSATVTAPAEPDISSNPSDLLAALEEDPLFASSRKKTSGKGKSRSKTGVPETLGEMQALDENLEHLVHIPCPNGHELDTPFEMIGQEALCPHCGVQFRLRNENSREYQQQRALIEQRQGEIWFKWAVGIAIVVGITLLVLVIRALTF